MEQHPVPRNITGFQFRLVGDMTLRQFGYLCAGALTAYLVYKLAPFPAIINFPLAGFFAFGGIAFAFLPIQERPLDKWVVAFVKSITSPTQFTWQKANLPPEVLLKPFIQKVVSQPPSFQNQHEEVKKKLRDYLKTLPSTPHERINLKEKQYIENTLALFYSTSTPNISSVSQTPTSYPQAKLQTASLSSSPSQPPAEPSLLTQSVTQPSSTPQPSAKDEHRDIQNQLAQLAFEKKRLEEELTKLQQNLKQTKEPPKEPPTAAPTIKLVPPKNAASTIGLPQLPQYPNLIIGAVKDPEKKILPNIIITIKDKDGLPLRALKTNKLGQFATATPLANGVYFLEFEDPLKRYVFDRAEITLSGKTTLPLEIIAKGEKEVLREKLTKQLFGSAVV